MSVAISLCCGTSVPIPRAVILDCRFQLLVPFHSEDRGTFVPNLKKTKTKKNKNKNKKTHLYGFSIAINVNVSETVSTRKMLNHHGASLSE